jgi:hypothetical protein
LTSSAAIQVFHPQHRPIVLVPPISGFNLSQFDGLSESPGKSQKEGQEDQGTLKQLGGPPSSLRLYKPSKALIKKIKNS